MRVFDLEGRWSGRWQRRRGSGEVYIPVAGEEVILNATARWARKHALKHGAHGAHGVGPRALEDHYAKQRAHVYTWASKASRYKTMRTRGPSRTKRPPGTEMSLAFVRLDELQHRTAKKISFENSSPLISFPR